jgi:hypothetical protein
VGANGSLFFLVVRFMVYLPTQNREKTA